jgi:hypothetical protein
MKSVLL